MTADNASALQSAYTTSVPGQTQLGERAVEFPKEAIDDAIIEAGGRIVAVIGQNPNSVYRPYFTDQTSSISDGGMIPSVSQANHPVTGVIGAVVDATTLEELEPAGSRQAVKGADSLSLKISPHLYYSDGSRIWHTRTSVIADVCVWEAQIERYWLAASGTRGRCPFPDSLTETLVVGSLSYLFRDTFNSEQAKFCTEQFNATLLALK